MAKKSFNFLSYELVKKSLITFGFTKNLCQAGLERLLKNYPSNQKKFGQTGRPKTCFFLAEM